MEDDSGRANKLVYDDGSVIDNVPPLRPKFFEYFFRTFLELQFEENVFTDWSESRPYYHFLASLNLFAHDDVDDRSMEEQRPCFGETWGHVTNGTEWLDHYDPLALRGFAD